MLFSRELITLLALASATVITAVPIHSEEVTPSPELGEICKWLRDTQELADSWLDEVEYGAEYKREEAVAPTPELGEICRYLSSILREQADNFCDVVEYGTEYKREEAVAPTPELGEICAYSSSNMEVGTSWQSLQYSWIWSWIQARIVKVDRYKGHPQQKLRGVSRRVRSHGNIKALLLAKIANVYPQWTSNPTNLFVFRAMCGASDVVDQCMMFLHEYEIHASTAAAQSRV